MREWWELFGPIFLQNALVMCAFVVWFYSPLYL